MTEDATGGKQQQSCRHIKGVARMVTLHTSKTHNAAASAGLPPPSRALHGPLPEREVNALRSQVEELREKHVDGVLHLVSDKENASRRCGKPHTEDVRPAEHRLAE